jgi:hypothetical protein
MKYVIKENGANEVDYATGLAMSIAKHCSTDTLIDLRGMGVTTLKGAPDVIDGSLNCGICHLSSLEYGPKIVKGNFDCSGNSGLTSLLGAPTGSFRCENIQITSAEGAPKFIGGDCIVKCRAFLSLANINKVFPVINGHLTVKNKVKSNVLSIFLIKGLTGVTLNAPDEVKVIVDKHIMNGRKGMMLCLSELVQAGYEDWAQL